MSINQNVAAQSGAPGAVARFTEAIFGIIPLSLTMLALRFALAVPFWFSGLTKWDGFLNLSFGAKTLFAEEFKLHIFGAELPYPAPELMATLSGVAEVTFPVMLVFGLGARYAAFGLLAMTAIIQLTVPDGWANFHLPWAAMALAIMTFGPGKIALDYILGLDASSRGE
ncbi:DoxX family protein [Methylocapsa sp. S129]|uniref:DoxX family protein n=1 Tax=Methylocapsa sp. S129 TaxID=1641869 RepID=UPI00131E0A5B